MSETVNNEMIAAADWMIYDLKNMFDMEIQSYRALAMEQKFKAAVLNRDVSKLREIVFHFLNINALNADRKLYDEHFKEIRNNECLTAFVDDLGADKDGKAARILMQINDVYTRIMSENLKLALDTMADVKVVYFDPKNIHFYNTEAHILFNVGSCDVFELWKAEFDTVNRFGSDMEFVRSFQMKLGSIDDFKTFVKSHNRENMSKRIRSGNFAVATSETAKDAKSVVSIVKDIILLNKIFYDNGQFNQRVLADIQKILIDKKTFPFKLLMQ